MYSKKTVIFFVLLLCVGVTASGCQTAADSVSSTDKWLDDELHKHM